MARTTEQIKADETLTEAVSVVLNAYSIQDDYVLTDYLVICAQSKIDEDGEAQTAYSYLYRDGDLPTHVILGLLDIAKTRIQGHVNSD